MQQEDDGEIRHSRYLLSIVCCVVSCLVAEGITAALSFSFSPDNFYKSVATFSIVGVITGCIVVYLNKYSIWHPQRNRRHSIFIALSVIFIITLLVSLAGYSIEWFARNFY